MSIRDSETGLYNETFLMERLEGETMRSRRTGIPFSLLLLEVKGWDELGRLPAETRADALNRFVEVVVEHVRASDSVYRAADNRVAVLFPETDLADATVPEGVLRTALHDADYSDLLPEGLAPLSAILALAGYPGDGTEAEDLLAVAEGRLEEAAESSRG
jgi:diguanylate cyclase (GGDEF)-like protein